MSIRAGRSWVPARAYDRPGRARAGISPGVTETTRGWGATVSTVTGSAPEEGLEISTERPSWMSETLM